jgi:hypothetical protein
MANPQRPRRARKGDRLTGLRDRANEVACHHAIAPFDRVAIEMDQRWGIDRLPELVSPETAAKYGNALAYLNQCIAEEDPAKVADAANNCIRGMNAMEAEAVANGHQPATGEHMEYELRDDNEVFRFAIIKDHSQWPALKAKRPDLLIFTLHEAAVALRGLSKKVALEAVKEHFPGAKVQNKPQLPPEFWNHGDIINLKGDQQ